MDPRGSNSPVLQCNACQVSCRKTLVHKMLGGFSALIFKKYILKSWFKKQQGFLKTEQESGRKPSRGGLVVIAPFVGNADCRGYGCWLLSSRWM